MVMLVSEKIYRAQLVLHPLFMHMCSRAYLHVIGDQMPAFASRAVHQDGAKVVGLLCDAMRRAFQTLLAGESHVVAGLHGLARGNGVFVGLDIFLWD